MDFVNFNVKGLFTFLLEDIVRPYQKVVFNHRIREIQFDNNNPHLRNGYNIKGRQEKLNDGRLNPLHYLTKCETKAHTSYLSKLATKIIKLTKKKPISRLEDMYDYIYIDEVQDLIGWDFEIIKYISKSKLINLMCVGDFRQTIYDSAITTKSPLSSDEKIKFFEESKFTKIVLNKCHRSIQEICDIADTVHLKQNYQKTISAVKNIDIDEDFKNHLGVYIVRLSMVKDYVIKYQPVVLRLNKNIGINDNIENLIKITYGKSKGLGFDRVLIFPTKPYEEFFKGNVDVFEKNKTEESKNKLYVTLTRGRYSVGILMPDEMVNECNIKIWEGE
ncbi:Superfamily I DNA and RNA helicases [Yersinia enterocolitica]|uniref:DNA 3'-5' helicase II n=1 Tax=Yersinia enterocolitica TaxID=630 RepID=A0A9P1PWJ4_YEREN|nr:Superfamily I DNA and RNA helicases [Yersinia enterocolitica]